MHFCLFSPPHNLQEKFAFFLPISRNTDPGLFPGAPLPPGDVAYPPFFFLEVFSRSPSPLEEASFSSFQKEYLRGLLSVDLPANPPYGPLFQLIFRLSMKTFSLPVLRPLSPSASLAKRRQLGLTEYPFTGGFSEYFPNFFLPQESLQPIPVIGTS